MLGWLAGWLMYPTFPCCRCSVMETLLSQPITLCNKSPNEISFFFFCPLAGSQFAWANIHCVCGLVKIRADYFQHQYVSKQISQLAQNRAEGYALKKAVWSIMRGLLLSSFLTCIVNVYNYFSMKWPLNKSFFKPFCQKSALDLFLFSTIWALLSLAVVVLVSTSQKERNLFFITVNWLCIIYVMFW